MATGSGGQEGTTQVVTLTPAGTQPRWLGTLGHVTPPTYSDTLPGGNDSLTCVLEREADYRTDALNTGRILRAYRGGSIVWNGYLLEATYGSGGWQVTANGAGNWGTLYDAIYTTWSNQNDAVNQAITRGLPWVNPGIPAGVWLGQVQDSGSMKITDLLNLFCTKGGYTWHVGRGNVLSVYLWKTAPVTRILTCQVPVARTLGGDISALYGRYQTSADGATAATFALTSSVNQTDINAHGRQEDYTDLSAGGQMTAGQAQALLTSVLNLYQRVSFGGPFTVHYGEYLTPGGQPVDLGCEKAGEIVQLIMTDFGYGGEVVPDPVTFVVGKTEYDDATGILTVTPFQTIDTSLSSLLTARLTGLAPKTHPHTTPHKPKPKQRVNPGGPVIGLHPRPRHRKHTTVIPGGPIRRP